MIGIRRLVILVGTLLTVTLGTSVPASAAFSAPASVPATTIATMVVAPPTNVVGNLACAKTSTMSATWKPSATPRISGYLVSVYFSDGLVQTVQLGATATSWSATIDEYYVTAYSVAYSVTAQTDYGWTKESARTGTFQC